MPDPAPDPQNPPQDTPADPPQDPPADPPADPSEEGLPDAVKAVLKKERDARREADRRAREAEAKAKQFEDRDKSEVQKAIERAEQAERDAAGARTQALRLRVGQAKSLPPEVAELLNGKDEKEMGEHADRLIAAGVKAPNGTPPPSYDGGARPPAEPSGAAGFDAAIRTAAGRGTS